MTDFGRRLKKCRDRKGMSREALSEVCGLHRQAVRRYERGEQEPKLSALVALADFLDVSVDWLAGRK